MQALDLDPQLVAELGVEVRQRLVEQEDGGVAHERPADRDALALAARELVRPAVEQMVDLQQLRRLRDPALDLGAAASSPSCRPNDMFSRTFMRG